MIGVDEIKTALRVTNDALDLEIQSVINAAVMDLWTAGITETDGELIDMAIRLYARWQFDYTNKADQYEKAYDSLKKTLSLIPEYNGGMKE